MKPKTASALAHRSLTPSDIALAIDRVRKTNKVLTKDAVRIVASKYLLSIAEVEDAAKAHRESLGAGS